MVLWHLFDQSEYLCLFRKFFLGGIFFSEAIKKKLFAPPVTAKDASKCQDFAWFCMYSALHPYII